MDQGQGIRVVEGRKFLWDGLVHATEEELRATEQAYREEGFEVMRLEVGEETRLLTRREVSEGP